MATTIEPDTTSENGTSRFGTLDWLDAKEPIFAKNEDAWAREERRYYGADAVLSELKQFDGETQTSFEERKREAEYNNFPKAHVQAITGELSRKRPALGKGLSLGGLGDVRSRDKLEGGPQTFAELVKYNIDGVGQDGSEFEPWMDGVDERAQVTGHRWLMIESSAAGGSALSLRDVLAGQRAYAVEYSPLQVPMWFLLNGQLQFAIIRVSVHQPTVKDGQFTDPSAKGYYVLVRRGCKNLGAAFERGGWFLFDSDRKFEREGRWSWTDGDIPMWIHYGQRSKGTEALPAISKSSTMELGQIAVGLMNIKSARDYDFWDACASRLLILGGEPTTMIQVQEQVAKRSIMIAVPFPQNPGTGDLKPITVFDGSTGAVAAQVSESIVKAKFEAAREQSFQQITSTPESTGESKKAGFAENKAPILAMRARERQQSENTLIHYFEKRFGILRPSGFSQWPTDFDLEPLADAIDKAFDTLRGSRLRSRTAEVAMAIAGLEDRRIINDDNKAKIQTELEASFDQQQATAEAQRKVMERAGAPINPET